MRRWIVEERFTPYGDWRKVSEVVGSEDFVASITHRHYGFRTGFLNEGCDCETCAGGWMIGNDWKEYTARYVAMDFPEHDVLLELNGTTNYRWTEIQSGGDYHAIQTNGIMHANGLPVEILVTDVNGDMPRHMGDRVIVGFYSDDDDSYDVERVVRCESIRDAVVAIQVLASPAKR